MMSKPVVLAAHAMGCVYPKNVDMSPDPDVCADVVDAVSYSPMTGVFMVHSQSLKNNSLGGLSSSSGLRSAA